MSEDLLEKCKALIEAVEGIHGSMEYGEFRSDRGIRLKDTLEWVNFYTTVNSNGRWSKPEDMN